ncbi:MAG: GAF domain-containing protein [Chloroflexi bacterium]|nr:GAF domain-containing protein [Chloroflexota bacterium]
MSVVRDYARDFRAAVRETQPLAYFEMLLGLGFIVAINLVLFSDNWGYFEANPHPFWLVILPVAARYGALPGYVVGFAATATYVLLIITQPRSAFAVDILSTEALLNPVLFVVVGAALGELRERQKRDQKRLAAKYDEVELGLQDIAQRYLAAVEINRELERRIVSQTSTVTTLYQAAKALEQLDVEELSPSLLELTTSFIEAEACALYLAQGGRFVLKVSRPEVVDFVRPAELDTTRGMAALVIGNKRTATIRDVMAEATPSQIVSQRLLMATPLLDQRQQIIGILTVEKMPFLRFTPSAVKLFTLLGDWASTAFQTALRFQESQDRNIDDVLTGAYSYPYFAKRLSEEIERARGYHLPLTLLALRLEDYELISPVRLPLLLQTLGVVFRQQVRSIDVIGKHPRGDAFLIALPHITVSDAQVLASRLRREIEAFGFKPFSSEEPLTVSVSAVDAVGVTRTEDAITLAIHALATAAPARALPRELDR